MKKTTSVFLILGLIMVFFSGCEDKLLITHYDTGEKFEEYQYIGDSIKHGQYRRYSPKGLLIEVSNYNNGLLEGERIIYNFQTGVKEISEIYRNDLLDGRHIVYHPNGEMQSLGVYNNNVLSGTVKFFDTSGYLKEEFQYVNNYEVIPFKEFHENGKIKWEGTKRYDHFTGLKKDYGLLIEYNEDGIIIRKIMCDEQEICATTWTINGSDSKERIK